MSCASPWPEELEALAAPPAHQRLLLENAGTALIHIISVELKSPADLA